MINVLVLADSPTCITGFGNVSRHILDTIHKQEKYRLTVVGINYDGFPPHKFPYDIIPATSRIVERYDDLYGRKRALDLLMSGQIDVFFCIQDPGVAATFMPEVKKIQAKLGKRTFTSILYFPVDSSLLTQQKWIQNGIATVDFPVVYTEYGKREILKYAPIPNLDICPHGVDLKDFHPLDKATVEEFKRTCITGLDLRNRFIVLNVNRNQIRKDYVRCFKAFAEVKKQVPCAFLFVLAQLRDQGGDLLEIAKQCGLEYGVDWVAPGDYNSAQGFDIQAVNTIYNIADVVFSSTVGEGWGLCVHPDTRIKTDEGYKKIKRIVPGMRVLTREGYRSVQGVISRKVQENLVSLVVDGRSENDPLLLTKEHLVATKRGWIAAGDLQMEDEIAQAPDSLADYQFYRFDIADLIGKLNLCFTEHNAWIHGSYNKKYKRHISLNKDFAELYGIYLAEGSASKNGIVFSISQEENEFLERIKLLVKKVWGLPVYVENAKDSKKRWVRVYGNILKEFYAEWAGTGARNKRIKLMSLLTKQTASKVLKGVWWGDGSKEKYGYEITTTSTDMAYDLSKIGDMLGMRLTMEYSLERRAYRLRAKKADAAKFSYILGDNSVTKSWLEAKDYSFAKVKAIGSVSYDGDVFDIQVEGTHEYSTSMGIIHNSSVEAMAVGKPCVFPNNTSLTEIFGNGERGYLIPSGDTPDRFICYGAMDSSLVRPTIDVLAAAKYIKRVFDNPKEAGQKVAKATEWIMEHTWNRVNSFWVDKFEEAYKETERRRNDPNLEEAGAKEAGVPAP